MTTIYYVKAKDENGEEVILKLCMLHHCGVDDVEDVSEISEKEMKREIEKTKTESQTHP